MAKARRKARFEVGAGGVVFLPVALLIYWAANHTQNNLLFWALGLTVGALMVSFLVPLAMLKGVEVERIVPPHAVAGEVAAIRYQVTNRKRWLPVFGLVIREDWGGRFLNRAALAGPLAENPPRLRGRPHGWVLHVGPRQTVQAEAIGFLLRRGRLPFERITIWTSFPFGILRRIISTPQPGEMLVYPHLVRVDRKLLYRLARPDASGRHRVKRSGGTEEFYGVRGYRPGDSLKLIDWRRTARVGDLISREMHHASPPRVVVALDLTRLVDTGSNGPMRGNDADSLAAPPKPSWWERLLNRPPIDDPALTAAIRRRDEIERAVSLAASVVCDAHFRGYQTGLSLVGVAGPSFVARHGVAHRTHMLEALADLGPLQPVRDKRLPEAPTVIVRPGDASVGGVAEGVEAVEPNGEGAAGNGGGRGYGVAPPAGSGTAAGGVLVLTTCRLSTSTTELEGGSAAILASGERRTRRQRTQEAGA